MIMINNNNENGNNNCGSDNNTNNTENNGTSNNMIKTIKKIWKVKDKENFLLNPIYPVSHKELSMHTRVVTITTLPGISLIHSN